MLDKAALKQIMVEMRANPEKFLRHYLVVINGGGSANAQAQMTFRMQEAKDGKGAVAGFQTGIRGQLGQLFSGWSKDRPKLQIDKVPDGTPEGPDDVVFKAYFIPMTGGAGGLPPRQVVLPGSGAPGDPDIALTSQMSGCTFGLGSANRRGDRLAAHIQPPGGPNAPTSQDYANMRNAASGGNNPANSPYSFFERETRTGAESYGGNPRNFGTIIGARSANNQWRFAAQTYNLDNRMLFKVERL